MKLLFTTAFLAIASATSSRGGGNDTECKEDHVSNPLHGRAPEAAVETDVPRSHSVLTGDADTSTLLLHDAVTGDADHASQAACIRGYFETRANAVNSLEAAALRIERASTGEVIYNHGADESFEIMSISKMFVGTVFNQLIDEGKVNYRDPMTDYLPDDIDTSNWCTSGDIKSVTLRDLLRHTSGFQNIWDSGPPKTEFLRDWETRGRDYAWTPREVLDYVPRLTNQCGSREGELEFSYADTNFLILGIIIEHITGNSLAREIRSRILERVGMPNTFMLYYETPSGTPVGTSCDSCPNTNIGDGRCNDNECNTAECNFDGGDCCDYSCDHVNSLYGCSGGDSKDVACKVKKPFTNEGDITTGWKSFAADWGGSGYVSTAEDLAKFIKTWYRAPGELFCPATSRCRMLSHEMEYWDPNEEDGYSMGMELVPYGDKFGYGHSGINNSFMFYVGPNGLIVTGTLNWYNGVKTDWTQHYLVKDMLSCIPTAGDDWLHDCPGEKGESRVSESPPLWNQQVFRYLLMQFLATLVFSSL